MKLGRIFHATHRVPDLGEVESWFELVFGRPSVVVRQFSGVSDEVWGAYPKDYSIFTTIADTLFDAVDPSLLIINGVQRYPAVTKPSLQDFGWYVDAGIDELFWELDRRGIRTTGQVEGVEGPPKAAMGGHTIMWTNADDTGLRYEFFPLDWAPRLDVRAAPGWSVPAVSDLDPLGVEQTSHHTILTSDFARASRLVIDVLGGVVVGQSFNPAWGSESTFVRVGDEYLEYGRPVVAGSLAEQALEQRAPHDCYHSITMRVADLDRVDAHLTSCGVGHTRVGHQTITAAPEAALGIPWGFTTHTISDLLTA